MTATTPAGVIARRRAFRDDPDANDHLWALVAAAQSAETDAQRQAAFGELYQLTRRVVFAFVRSRVGDHGTAEDLTADAYERAYTGIGKVTRKTGSPSAWLVTIARNLVADHHKSARVRTTLVVEDVAPRTPEGRPEFVNAPDLTADTVIDAAASVRDAIALLGAVTRLTAEQRDAVRLRYLEGKSIEETAAELGKLGSAVKALTYRAVRALARDPEVAALDPSRLRLVA